MSKSYRDPSGDARVGTVDGQCYTCGAPRMRMGWLNYSSDYWLMCTVSKLGGDDDRYGRCSLPTEAQARRRLGVTA